MLIIPAGSATRTVTLCNSDGPIGTCDFIDGKFVVQAEQADRQAELECLLNAKFRMHARLSRKDGIVLEKQQFFEDISHYLRGTYCYATRPIRSFTPLLPKRLQLPPFDPFKPRQRRSNG